MLACQEVTGSRAIPLLAGQGTPNRACATPGLDCGQARWRRISLRAGLACQHSGERVVVERADDSERLRLTEHGCGYLSHLIVGDSLDLG